MKIEEITLYHVAQRLKTPFVTSFGAQQARQCLLLRLRAEGVTAWGECVATNSPGYSYETVKTAWHVLSDFLIPSILGQDIEEPDELAGYFKGVRGHPLAKATLDQALWDATAQRDGVSMATKLAAPYKEGPRSRVPVGVSVGLQASLAATVATVGEYIDKGYRRIKLKIKPGKDVAVAAAIREAFPDVALMLDANSAYTLADASLLAEMDQFNLLMIEQPLGYDDIYDHSQLRPLIQSPLCLDESIHSAEHTRYAIVMGACDIINIKPARVGGWTEARRVHDLCVEAGLGVWCGGMLETGIGRAAQLALASLPGFTLPGDISATERYYEQDVTTPFELNREDSTIDVPTGPGLGIEVDEAYIETISLQQERFNV
ncbi:MAG TPA: o-succinylbenzoate synthase [Anaerolineae bacterium]|nr:o-succinylbenzoate synthase [Anaerolineae bacterium]